jgi:PHP family Zn ribbon phosphoesterase
MGAATKKVNRVYFDLLEKLGSELNILLNVPAENISHSGYPAVADAIDRVRSRRVSVEPGYDGEYGKIRL